jgi:hypothetical protein
LAYNATKKAVNIISMVLPLAIAAQVPHHAWVVKFTRNDPRKTPGQIPCPNRRSTASAIPDGGHTAVAFGEMVAKCKPTYPDTK